jgi:molybdopterin synthase sulfur carrier subunit
MLSLTGGKKTTRVPGTTVRQVVNNLEKEFPGIKDRLCDEEGDLLPSIAVVIDGETSQLGLLERVQEDSEVHFLPAISGGSIG